MIFFITPKLSVLLREIPPKPIVDTCRTSAAARSLDRARLLRYWPPPSWQIHAPLPAALDRPPGRNTRHTLALAVSPESPQTAAIAPRFDGSHRGRHLFRAG